MKHLKTVRVFQFVIVGLSLFLSQVFAQSNEEIFEQQETVVSPSGELLAVYWFESITIFNIVTGEKLHEFEAGTEDPFVLKFSADSSKLISSGWDAVSVWDLDKGERSARKETTENAECGVISNDHSKIYYDDQYSDFGHKQLIVTNGSLAKEAVVFKNNADCKASADQTLLAIQSYQFDDSGFSVEDTQINIINLDTAEIQNSFNGDEADAYDEDMFFFDNNRKLLVRDYSDFHIWDIDNNTLLKSVEIDMDVDEVSVSGNLALLTDDLPVGFWDLTKEPEQFKHIPLPENHDELVSASLSKSGELYVVTSSIEYTDVLSVSIIDAKSNNVKHQMAVNYPGWNAVFANNDSMVVLQNYPIQVIDVTTGSVVHEFEMD